LILEYDTIIELDGEFVYIALNDLVDIGLFVLLLEFDIDAELVCDTDGSTVGEFDSVFVDDPEIDTYDELDGISDTDIELVDKLDGSVVGEFDSILVGELDGSVVGEFDNTLVDELVTEVDIDPLFELLLESDINPELDGKLDAVII
jgi:hypothetical protein